jgi:hypothetical protein
MTPDDTPAVREAAVASAAFRAMADAIDANPSLFAGAYLIIPPGDQDPVDGLPLTTRPNPAVFWSSVEGQVSVAIETLRAHAQRGFR